MESKKWTQISLLSLSLLASVGAQANSSVSKQDRDRVQKVIDSIKETTKHPERGGASPCCSNMGKKSTKHS